MNSKRSLKNARTLFVFGIYLIIIGIVVFSQKQPRSTSEVEQPQNLQNPAKNEQTEAKVTRVFDGDTIEIEGGMKIRYIGIDAAEVYAVRHCFSDEALIRNKELVLGKVVRLEKDVSETDKYGRLLRYVYVKDANTIRDVFVNDYLVRNGFAKVMTVQPDVKYANLFLELEKTAKEKRLGLWGNCP